MQAQKITKITLNSGRKIPIIGLGTYCLTGQNGVKSILTAIKNGYTHLDTATMYGNERQIKKAIQLSGVPRNQLFITSKVGPNEQGAKLTRQAVTGILNQIGIDYIDLMLIHWPATYKNKNNDKQNQNIRLETWKTLIQMQKQGKIKDIGVSNFLKHHLEHLLQNSDSVPVINQIQIHPLLWQGPTIQYCQKHNIALQAYSPLAHHNEHLFKNKAIEEIAKKYNKSLAQICLRWGIQHNLIILPKSSNEKRIKQNIDIFDFQISQNDMKIIQQQTKKNIRTDWNPHSIIY